jgi:hypothetical protein
VQFDKTQPAKKEKKKKEPTLKTSACKKREVGPHVIKLKQS